MAARWRASSKSPPRGHEAGETAQLQSRRGAKKRLWPSLFHYAARMRQIDLMLRRFQLRERAWRPVLPARSTTARIWRHPFPNRASDNAMSRQATDLRADIEAEMKKATSMRADRRGTVADQPQVRQLASVCDDLNSRCSTRPCTDSGETSGQHA